EKGDPWKGWDDVLADPKAALPKELARHVDRTIVKSWQTMHKDRREFLELLSRVDLSLDQAIFLVEPSQWADHGLTCSPKDILKNPYLIYEATRLEEFPIALGKVDQAVFPNGYILKHFPLPERSRVDTPVDARRLRALVIQRLEAAASEGHTLQTRAELIGGLRDRGDGEQKLATLVTEDVLRVAEQENYPGEVRVVQTAAGDPAYQLERLAQVGELIRQTVRKRAKGRRHDVEADWRGMLDDVLGKLPKGDDLATEERARKEKTAVLAELAASRISVLIGPAGTGKTTLLSVLCKHPDVSAGGILLLAPTGKARVRMESVIGGAGVENMEAMTIAQFLSRTGRYEGYLGRYRLLGEDDKCDYRTVIVDECSMLTEEMMASLFEAMKGVHRLILVGDHRQLPPIGAGRPFLDTIQELKPDDLEQHFPRVGTGFAELTITRRQGGTKRDDLLLAQWFGGAEVPPGEDVVFDILSGKRASDTVRFVPWETVDELEKLLPDVLAEALEFPEDKDEKLAFDLSLGAKEFNGYTYFNWGQETNGAEAWQILSPVRQKPWGVDVLNRTIHERYRAHFLAEARKHGRYPRFLRPQGEDQIVYGDKVINISNHRVYKSRIYPNTGEPGYLANGEIGMVVGQMRTKKFNHRPSKLQVEFSTQRGQVFDFYESDFKEDGDTDLELAYALTIHKAQGSEFDIVFLVLPRSPLMLSRELLYTALTRQKHKVVVLHQGTAAEVQALSGEAHSSAARRMTNLFQDPRPAQVRVGNKDKRFLEERLLHVTSKGEAVRSKSEVIIADKLAARNLTYRYEHPLELGGTTKYPDFTIEDDDAGITYYWEHCGMLMDPAYKARWEEKQQWYRDQGILPHAEGGGKKGTLIVTVDDER
ncbi:MAG: AAA family ATPase, partial [Flavobacteriales bacterium]|nr:AAA family ATPase [Flavobacteriales bacterium]